MDPVVVKTVLANTTSSHTPVPQQLPTYNPFRPHHKRRYQSAPHSIDHEPISTGIAESSKLRGRRWQPLDEEENWQKGLERPEITYLSESGRGVAFDPSVRAERELSQTNKLKGREEDDAERVRESEKTLHELKQTQFWNGQASEQKSKQRDENARYEESEQRLDRLERERVLYQNQEVYRKREYLTSPDRFHYRRVSRRPTKKESPLPVFVRHPESQYHAERHHSTPHIVHKPYNDDHVTQHDMELSKMDPKVPKETSFTTGGQLLLTEDAKILGAEVEQDAMMDRIESGHEDERVTGSSFSCDTYSEKAELSIAQPVKRVRIDNTKASTELASSVGPNNLETKVIRARFHNFSNVIKDKTHTSTQKVQTQNTDLQSLRKSDSPKLEDREPHELHIPYRQTRERARLVKRAPARRSRRRNMVGKKWQQLVIGAFRVSVRPRSSKTAGHRFNDIGPAVAYGPLGTVAVPLILPARRKGAFVIEYPVTEVVMIGVCYFT